MKKLLLLLVPLLFLTSCGTEQKKTVASLEDVTLVLDYVPNTNHTGIYLAKEKGYYKAAGLNVKIIEPGDNATSIGLVGARKAQFGVSYQEDVTYAHADGQTIPVKAIAAILKNNTSGFASLKNSGITSPKDFAGKTYAGWQSPSEEAILKAVMKKANLDISQLKIIGSNGDGPESLGKQADIQWYFEGWDMIKAKEAGLALNYLPITAVDQRLNFYTPVIIANDSDIKKRPELVEKFMKATKKGYQEAIKQPKESAKILHTYAKEAPLAFLEDSQNFLSEHYTDQPEKWGVMKEDIWNNYTYFMKEYGLIKKSVPAKELYTNEFLEDKK